MPSPPFLPVSLHTVLCDDSPKPFPLQRMGSLIQPWEFSVLRRDWLRTARTANVRSRESAGKVFILPVKEAISPLHLNIDVLQCDV